MKHPTLIAISFAFAAACALQGQTFKGPSTASTPYVQPTLPGWETYSVLTVDNATTTDDVVPKVGGGNFSLNGIPDGMGAFDSGNGEFTIVVNHEFANTSGSVARSHGAIGSYVSKFTINKNTLAVTSGDDLIKQVYRWNSTLQQSNPTPTTTAFNRFCSADLPAVSAFYNSKTGLGTQNRIYMHGEEGGTGWQQATVVTGPDAGKSYTLGKFNLNSNGSGINALGAWENTLACPYEQDKTIVMGNNDGGSGIMTNAVSVYIGTKQATGSETDKAGLNNGILRMIRVIGNPVEVANDTSRVTNIVNGTRFELSPNASTTFSRPEDGCWNPANPAEYYMVTTDRLDQVGDGVGSTIGRTRLWRFTFDDITKPELGGKIDVLIDGRTVGTDKVNMFDNMTINEVTGRLIIQEDVGGAAHNGKIWEYDPANNSLVKIAKHDVNRFGDIGVNAKSPYNNDEEGSGVTDITKIMADSSMNAGNPREGWYISADQTHYTTGISNTQVEGGQLFVMHDIAPTNNVTVTRSGFARDRKTGLYFQTVTIKNETAKTMAGPFHLVLDSLSVNCTLTNGTGNTAQFAPLNSPCATIIPGSLAPGATATVTLQFSNPNNTAIAYTARTLNAIPTP